MNAETVETGSERQSNTANAGRQHSPITPWDRFGWLMAVIWLCFLAFPIVDLIDRSGSEKILGLAATGTFAIIYVIGFVRFPFTHPTQRIQTVTLLMLIVVAGIAAIPLGPQAVTFLPFITAFGVYYQPLRRAIILSATWLTLAIVTISITDTWQLYGIVAGIVLLVGLATFIPRWLDSQQQAFNALERQYALSTERERMARDVHDVLGHSLTVIAVKAELAGRLLEVSPQKAGKEVEAIESLSREALSEIRATVAGLRVSRLEDELENAAGVLPGAGISLDVDGVAADVDPRQRLVAGWVVREAITNVVRHSGATTCTVELATKRITITDDGIGLGKDAGLDEVEATQKVWGTAGTGLQGLRERVTSSGGELTIKNVTAGGTRVEVIW